MKFGQQAFSDMFPHFAAGAIACSAARGAAAGRPDDPSGDVAALPDDERVQWIRAERWISHPAISTVNTRMVNQLTNAVNAVDPDDMVILQVARAPTATEIMNLGNALGQTESGVSVLSRINIVSSQSDLYNLLNAGLH